MKKRAFCYLLTGVLAASLLAGCGQSAPAETAASTDAAAEASGEAASEAAPAAALPEGKVLRLAVSSENDTLDPGLNDYLSASSVIASLFMGLERTGADGSSIVPGCAESYDVSDDDLTYTFHLYDDLKWSDGSPLTANDFVYSWLRVMNPETASPTVSDFYVIKGAEDYSNGTGKVEDVAVKAVDDTTLEVTLVAPTPFFPSLTTDCSYQPVKQSAVESSDTWSMDPAKFVSNGAFTLTGYTQQVSYVLTKNPNFKYADEVKLDGAEISFISDSTAAQTALENGEIDMTNNISVAAQEKYSGTANLKEYEAVGTNYLDVNTEHITDARIRRALSLAIDRDTLNSKFVASKPISATGWIPGNVAWYEGDKTYREVTGDLISYDPDEAKKLIDEAVADGFDITAPITYICKNDSEATTQAQALQAMWKAVGFNIEITTYESGSYWDVVHSGDFDLAVDGWSGDFDPSSMIQTFIKGQNDKNNRWSGEGADKYDTLYKDAGSTGDQARRFDDFQQAEKILLDEMPIIPLSFKKSQMLVSDNVTNAVNDSFNHYLLLYDDIKE